MSLVYEYGTHPIPEIKGAQAHLTLKDDTVVFLLGKPMMDCQVVFVVGGTAVHVTKIAPIKGEATPILWIPNGGQAKGSIGAEIDKPWGEPSGLGFAYANNRYALYAETGVHTGVVWPHPNRTLMMVFSVAHGSVVIRLVDTVSMRAWSVMGGGGAYHYAATRSGTVYRVAVANDQGELEVGHDTGEAMVFTGTGYVVGQVRSFCARGEALIMQSAHSDDIHFYCDGITRTIRYSRLKTMAWENLAIGQHHVYFYDPTKFTAFSSCGFMGDGMFGGVSLPNAFLAAADEDGDMVFEFEGGARAKIHSYVVKRLPETSYLYGLMFGAFVTTTQEKKERSCFDLGMMSVETFRVLRKYIYTGILDVTAANAVDLLQAGDFLGMTQIDARIASVITSAPGFTAFEMLKAFPAMPFPLTLRAVLNYLRDHRKEMTFENMEWLYEARKDIARDWNKLTYGT